MSEEVKQEFDTEVENTAAQEFIDALQAQNFNKAKDHFSNMLNDKLQTRLDAEKVAVAGSIFNGADEDITDEELSDEEIDDIVQDEINDEEEDVVTDEVEDEEENVEDVEGTPQVDETGQDS